MQYTFCNPLYSSTQFVGSSKQKQESDCAAYRRYLFQLTVELLNVLSSTVQKYVNLQIAGLRLNILILAHAHS